MPLNPEKMKEKVVKPIVVKKLPLDYEGTWRKITKGKHKGWYMVFDLK